MNTMMNWIRSWINSTIEWWNNNHEDVINGLNGIIRDFERIMRGIERLIFVGIVVNIIAHFCPEFHDRFPIIYGWFDGWLQLGEFAIKSALGGIYSFFTGNFTEFWSEYTTSYNELWLQFQTWLSQIHF